MAFKHQADGTQISRRFKVHNLITCESKVQVFFFPRELVSFDRPKELVIFSPRRVTRSPRMENVFELGGITI